MSDPQDIIAPAEAPGSTATTLSAEGQSNSVPPHTHNGIDSPHVDPRYELERGGWEFLGEQLNRIEDANQGQTSILRVGNLPPRRYYKVFVHIVDTGGPALTGVSLRLNDDSGSNYGYRAADNIGNAPAATSNAAQVVLGPGLNASHSCAAFIDIFSHQKYVKIGSWMLVDQDEIADNAVAPEGRAGLFKWKNKTDEVNAISIVETSGGFNYFGVGSLLRVYGCSIHA